jgi:hypothetical protein
LGGTAHHRGSNRCRRIGRHTIAEAFTVTAWLRRFLGLRHYNVTVRMEWSDGDWVKTTAEQVSARSRAAASAEAIRIAQRGIETGWDRVIVECEAA